MDLKAIEVVKREKLVDYLMENIGAEGWTKDGWDKVFEELKTNITYVD